MKHTTMNTDAIQQLASVPFLHGVERSALQSVAQHCRWRTFSPEQQVIVHGDNASEDVFFITEGRVRITLFAPNGREVIFQDAGKGDMFGELAAIDTGPRSTFVTGLTRGKCMTLKAPVFRDLLQENDVLATRVLKSLSTRIRFLSDRIYEYSSLRVKDRVRAELLRIAMERGNGETRLIAPFPTHAEIASRISTHREAVTRELNSLARHGVIGREHRNVRVHDLYRLQQMIGQDSL